MLLNDRKNPNVKSCCGTIVQFVLVDPDDGLKPLLVYFLKEAETQIKVNLLRDGEIYLILIKDDLVEV